MNLPDKLPYGVVQLLTAAAAACLGEHNLDAQKKHWRDVNTKYRWEVVLQNGPSKLERRVVLSCFQSGVAGIGDAETFVFTVKDLLEWPRPESRSAASESYPVIRGIGNHEIIVAGMAEGPNGQFIVCENNTHDFRETRDALIVQTESGSKFAYTCEITGTPIKPCGPRLLEDYINQKGAKTDAAVQLLLSKMRFREGGVVHAEGSPETDRVPSLS